MNYVRLSIEDRVGFVTLARPEKRNALNGEMIQELNTALQYLEQSSEASIAVLRAEGKAFCAGADLEYLGQLRSFSQEQNLEDSRRFRDLLLTLYQFKKVTIAQVQGPAVAGGAGLVSVCDFAFGSQDMVIGYPEVKIGFIPAIVMPFLLRKISESKVKVLLLTGQLINANVALEMGLLYRIVERQDLEKEVVKFAKGLCSTTSAESRAITKKLITSIPNLSIEEALDLVCKHNSEGRTTLDFLRGISDFLAKKNTEW